jgi:acetolactate synthase-1/2/3 large subunit
MSDSRSQTEDSRSGARVDPRSSGAVAALRVAASAGVELCFANPGTTELPLVAALDAVPQIKAVLGLFEGVCTGAADGYGRMAGKPALTLVHLGPGFANGIANLHNARRARSPIVNLIGDHASWHLKHDAPLTSDIASLAAPVSDWLRTSTSASTLAGDMAAALKVAKGPPGAVATLIARADHQWETPKPASASTPETIAPAGSQSLSPDAVGKRIAGAKKVTLLLGGSALSANGQRAAGRIAAHLDARVWVETFPARWERGRDLPRFERLPYFPEQAQEALADADLIVLAGARNPISFFGYEGVESQLASPARIVFLAEPREDAEIALTALAECIGALGEAPDSSDQAPPTPGRGALDSVSIGQTLAAHLPENAIVMEEGATSSLPFYGFSSSAAPHTLMSLTGGAIGQGLPCATGAALACPDRKVIAFQADGSGMYTLQALWTQARENLQVTTVLCSNRAYRILQVELARSGNVEPGPQARSLTSLDNPELDWVSLARGCGVPGTRVETAEAFSESLQRALGEGGPHLLELMI